MMNGKKIILTALLAMITSAVFSEDISPSDISSEKLKKENTETAERQPEVLPSGFMNIRLGQNMDELEDSLTENSYFDYRGRPDVDMRISNERNLIECSGFSYIKKGYFQFYQKKLIIITILIDENELDFYSFYVNFEKKYGKPHSLNPDGVYWENDDISLSLEKPLSVKYVDKKAFEEIKEKSASKETRQKILKGDFIDTF